MERNDWALAGACLVISGLGLAAVPFVGTRYGDWPEAVALGRPGAHRWDYVALVRYPSRAAFLDMMTSADYAQANVERENGCEDHAIIAVRETYNKIAKA